jgi:ribonuclease J
MFDKKQIGSQPAGVHSSAPKKTVKYFGKPLEQRAYHVRMEKTSKNSNQPKQNHAGKQNRQVNMPKKNNIAAKAQPVQVNAKSDHLRITPLGGNEEVGRNMTLFEYGGDIIILDMGIQFPEEDMPGIDYIIPNISYLKGREKNVRGVILSHGHLDHIGAAPILLRELGYPPVVGRDLTLALVKRRMDDFEKNSAQKLRTIRIGSLSEKIRLGKFEIEFFDVEHSVMDAVGVIIKTPDGTVIHPGDWTMEKNPTDHKVVTYSHLSKLPSPRILMLESLGAIDSKSEDKPESEMYNNLEKLISSANGLVIIGTFSSQIQRIGKIIEYAESIGKKVALDGYSMKMNIEIAKELGYIKAHKKTLISANEIHKYPRNRVVVICTGAQGEGNAVLSRIVNDEHRFVHVQKNDTIIFSSSIVPGNERTVQRLKDDLYRKCDNVIHSDILDVHISGHSNAHDIQDILRQIRPDFFLPVYGNHYMLKEAAKLGERTGIRKENIFVLDNGHQLELGGNRAKLLPNKVDTAYVMVDGLGVGDVGEVVLRDRQLLAKDGMFTIVVIIDSRTKKIIGTPQITSRGFIFVKENFDLVNATKRVVEKVVKEKTSEGLPVNWDYVKNNIRESVGSFLFTKTERRPMVLPVVIEV